MKIRWIFNALAAMEAVLCPALCLMYAFCGLALWTQTVYFCPLLGAVLAVAAYILLKRYLDRREEQALARARQAEEGKRE